MLKHVVLYKLKDKSQETLAKITEGFLSMVGKIPSLLLLECGADMLCSDRSYDYCLICVFNDLDGLKQYLAHPAHLPVKAFMHEQYVGRYSVDFEF